MPLSKKSQRFRDGLADQACAAIERLRELGVDHAEARVGFGKELEVAVREGKLELVKEAQSRSMGVRVVCDGRVATSASGTSRI